MPLEPLHFIEDDLDALFMRAVNDRPTAHLSLKSIDTLMGGINAGRLAVISGEPGAAKTTLLGQLADDLASSGTPVLFFSFELAAQALLSKSLSRLAGNGAAVGRLADAYRTVEGANSLDSALEAYRATVAPRLAYIDRPCSPVKIGQLVADCENTTGQKPVVMLDYLQICEQEHQSALLDERLVIKETVMGLREVANTYDVQVIAISSINRTSYDAKPALKSLGGCSFIEYSADTVLHLAVEGKGDEREMNMAKAVRPLTLTALKNRYGATGTAHLDFEPVRALFTDREGATHGRAE